MARFRLVSLSSFVAFYQSRSILVGAKAMVLTFLTLLVLVDGGWAQAAPGIVPFSTRAGGNVDSLDLATGAVALNIPVRTKNGKTSLTFSKFGNTFMSTENSGSTWDRPLSLAVSTPQLSTVFQSVLLFMNLL